MTSFGKKCLYFIKIKFFYRYLINKTIMYRAMLKFITDRKKKINLFPDGGIRSFSFFQVVVDKIKHVLQGQRHFSFWSLRVFFFLHHRGCGVFKSFFEVHHQICLKELLVHHKVLCQSHVFLLHLQHLRTGHIGLKEWCWMKMASVFQLDFSD